MKCRFWPRSLPAPTPVLFPAWTVLGPLCWSLPQHQRRSGVSLSSFDKASPCSYSRGAPGHGFGGYAGQSAGSKLLWSDLIELPGGPSIQGRRQDLASGQHLESWQVSSQRVHLPPQGPFLLSPPLTRDTATFILKPTSLLLVREGNQPEDPWT